MPKPRAPITIQAVAHENLTDAADAESAPGEAPVAVAAQTASRCGIDSVEISRIERLLSETPAEALRQIFPRKSSPTAATGPGRAASLAARFAAKEACVKLFPRELALGQIEPAEFSVARDAYGAPQIVCGVKAQALLDRHRVRTIAVSLTHDRSSASAVVLAIPAYAEVPLAGKVLYHLLPLRKAVILDNLRRVFGPRRLRPRSSAWRKRTTPTCGVCSGVSALSLAVGGAPCAHRCDCRMSRLLQARSIAAKAC